MRCGWGPGAQTARGGASFGYGLPVPRPLRCSVLLNLTLTPGRKDSPDGPARDVSLRCRRVVGHRPPHRFPKVPR